MVDTVEGDAVDDDGFVPETTYESEILQEIDPVGVTFRLVVSDDRDRLNTRVVETPEQVYGLAYVIETRTARMEKVARVYEDIVPLIDRIVNDTFEGAEKVTPAVV